MHELTIAEAGARIAAGQLSPVTLTEHLLDRIDRLNGRLNAFIRVTAEQALGEARQAEVEIKAGNLRGRLAEHQSMDRRASRLDARVVTHLALRTRRPRAGRAAWRQ